LLCSCHQAAPVPAYAAEADSLINDAVQKSNIPGAVLCVVEDDHVAYMKAYGYRQVFPDTLPMTVDVQFDLASLSKIVGTGFSMMKLIDEGLVNLDAPIRTYLPEYQTEATIRDYMTHTSGMPAYATYTVLLTGHDSAGVDERKQLLYDHMATLNRLNVPASEDTAACEFRYSCLNFISLQHVIEHVSGKPLNEFARESVFLPLGMTHTTYYPLGTPHDCVVAPTERIAGGDVCYEGIVHDPLAREMMSGVSGNAGVFSTAEDLSKLAIWMLGHTDELHRMMSIPEGYEKFGRALSWDVCSDYAGCKGSKASASAVCHTGYTGTAMVVDPEKRKAYILLTNRAHPSDGGAVGGLRRAIADVVFAEPEE